MRKNLGKIRIPSASQSLFSNSKNKKTQTEKMMSARAPVKRPCAENKTDQKNHKKNKTCLSRTIVCFIKRLLGLVKDEEIEAYVAEHFGGDFESLLQYVLWRMVSYYDGYNDDRGYTFDNHFDEGIRRSNPPQKKLEELTPKHFLQNEKETKEFVKKYVLKPMYPTYTITLPTVFEAVEMLEVSRVYETHEIVSDIENDITQCEGESPIDAAELLAQPHPPTTVFSLSYENGTHYFRYNPLTRVRDPAQYHDLVDAVLRSGVVTKKSVFATFSLFISEEAWSVCGPHSQAIVRLVPGLHTIYVVKGLHL